MDLRSLTPAELAERVRAAGEPEYRAEQVFRWLHGRGAADGVESAAAMSNVPRALADSLLAGAPLAPLAVDVVQQAVDGTRKLRFRTHDGRAIESVLIPDENRREPLDFRLGWRRSGKGTADADADADATGSDDEDGKPSRHLPGRLLRDKLTLCVSSQVGCALDCAFCATATLGFGRHLSAGEIVEQVYHATRVAGRRPTNLVFMGMGEPTHNFEGVSRALTLLQHPWGAAFSARRITVSTVGVVPGIEKLGRLMPAPNLAISLNATTDEVRDRIMPVNRRWPIAALLDAARRFPLSHGRRVTFEYVLLAGVNDSDDDAGRLPRLLRGIPTKVNLIPWNPFAGPAFARPSAERIRSFQERLRAGGLAVYIRTPRGDDIDAACGQLAARAEDPPIALSNRMGADGSTVGARRGGSGTL
ncbi:MAG TPA: 23S rRNA (adenine(2503)-C(2))-methyltransferase RlmN [Polyangia bacterium]|nr:23S rRNA (adenine(2503)-C(2))-methyltransferase RlmN [Polyangia bacterium]